MTEPFGNSEQLNPQGLIVMLKKVAKEEFDSFISSFKDGEIESGINTLASDYGWVVRDFFCGKRQVGKVERFQEYKDHGQKNTETKYYIARIGS